MNNPVKIGIIISSTRQGRFGDHPATWIDQHMQKQAAFSPQLVDLRDFPLPFFDEEKSPIRATPPVAKAWSDRMGAMDGFIFVVAEYNHGIPAVLKNALDHAYPEFVRKPAAYIGYGGLGAARAIEQLRLNCIELQMAPLRHAVHITMEPYMAVAKGERQLSDFSYLNESAQTMLDDLAWWTRALQLARQTV